MLALILIYSNIYLFIIFAKHAYTWFSQQKNADKHIHVANMLLQHYLWIH